jgi:cytochrome c553
MRIQKTLITSLFCLMSANVLAAGDYEEGKIKAYTCSGCHGIVDYNNVYPTYHVPRIGGQNPEYLAIALKAFRSGERTHSNMNLQAEGLSDQDIDDISIYLAGQTKEGTATSAGSDGSAGQSKSAACQACHGPTGTSTQPIYPNLGGQHQNYLTKSLLGFRDGSRANAIMSGFASGLSDADIQDIATWYASQTGLTEIQDK